MTAAAAVLTVGAGLPGAGPAAAADDGPVPVPSTTLPGERMAVPRWGGLAAGDGSGYLSSLQPADPAGVSTWIRRDGTKVEGIPNAVAYNGGYGLERLNGSRTYRIRHYATGKTVTFDLPAGDTSTDVFAADRLMTLRTVNGKSTLHILQASPDGGEPTDRQVAGVPDDMGPAVYTPASDDRGAALWWKPVGGGAWRTALLDWASGRLTLVPSDDFGLLEYPRLSAHKVVFMAIDKGFNTKSLYVIDRHHPERPGTFIDSLDGVKDFQTEVATVGDWLVYVRPGDERRPVRAVPLGGGPARTLLPRSQGVFAPAGDGSLLVEGGDDAEHWAVQRITADADGAPAAAPRDELPAVSVYEVGGMAVDQGRLLLASEHAEATERYAGTYLRRSRLSLSADGKVTAGPPEDLGDLGYWVPGDDSGDPGSGGYYSHCYGPCLQLTGTGEGSMVHRVYGVPTVVSAAGSYLVVRPTGDKQEVRDGDKVLRSGPAGAASLRGDTLWTPGAEPGTVTSAQLPSLKTTGTVDVGATCTPEDLQAVGRWIYWSCGPDGDAGVYDRTSKKLIDVPSGYAQLADGYLVNQDAGQHKLMITYFPGAVPDGQAGTGELGPLPAPVDAPSDERGRMWAVDRFGGAVAYLDAKGDVAVKWPRVRTSALAVIAKRVPGALDLTAGRSLNASWHTSKPVSSWKLTFRRLDTGAVVETITGGAAVGRIQATWDGTSGGRKVPTGAYRWTLTARSADRTDESVSVSGALAVHSP